MAEVEIELDTTERVGDRYPEIGKDIVAIDDLVKGKVITSPNEVKQEDFVHYEIKHLRALMNDIYKAYSNKKTTKKDFVKIIEKHKDQKELEVSDFLESVDKIKEDKAFKVVEKKVNKKTGEVTIKFKEIKNEEKKKYIKSITEKLLNRLTKEQLAKMLNQSLMKLNNIDTLKRVDKKLDKENPKIEEHQGCFFLTIDGVDLWMVN